MYLVKGGAKMRDKKDKSKNMLSDANFEETKHYSKRYAATVLSVISIVFAIVAVVGGILLHKYIDDLEAFANEHIVLGAIIFSVVCAVQVIFAFIPGEIVEVAAGVLFGPWIGTLLCLVAETVGSVIVIMLVRKFGRRLIESLYPREKIDALPILNEPKKRNAFIFLLFFIPGTPKDFLTYIVGLTKISISAFALITFFARIPSVVGSTFAGDSIAEGQFLQAFIILGVTALVSGIGYLIYNAINKKNAKSKKKKQEESEDKGEQNL